MTDNQVAILTDQQIERIAVLATIRQSRKQREDRCNITIIDPRLIAELKKWCKELNATKSAVVESILYEAFFPGEKTPAEKEAGKIQLLECARNVVPSISLRPQVVST